MANSVLNVIDIINKIEDNEIENINYNLVIDNTLESITKLSSHLMSNSETPEDKLTIEIVKKDESFESLTFFNEFVKKIDNLTLEDFTDKKIDSFNSTTQLLKKYYDLKSWRPKGGHNIASRRNFAKTTTITKYPFLVSINVQGEFICAGSIISKNLVISAAACLQRRNRTLRRIDFDKKSQSLLGNTKHVVVLGWGTMSETSTILQHTEFNQNATLSVTVPTTKKKSFGGFLGHPDEDIKKYPIKIQIIRNALLSQSKKLLKDIINNTSHSSIRYSEIKNKSPKMNDETNITILIKDNKIKRMHNPSINNKDVKLINKKVDANDKNIINYKLPENYESISLSSESEYTEELSIEIEDLNKDLHEEDNIFLHKHNEIRQITTKEKLIENNYMKKSQDKMLRKHFIKTSTLTPFKQLGIQSTTTNEMFLKPSTPWIQSIRTVYGFSRIGCRDVVGHGINGSANYQDDAHFPFPAVRFKENTRDICALREKERCDWRCLSCEEKKALYRASFCQTFAEFKAPTGQWKFIMGWVFITTSFGFWAAMFFHHYVYEPLPCSFSEASQKAQLRRMLELRVNPIDGISSLWDYDNDRWKWTRESNMKCAVAIVLALIGLSLAHPAPSGIGGLVKGSLKRARLKRFSR
ncbi:unnamed protein product, partial [Brenthis ino]